ncbi:MAG TPA: OmpA family protein [Puia sp.]|nr:OmpA family protein [Puia sp.]
MKRLLLAVISSICLLPAYAQVNDPNQVAKDAATNQANNDMNNAAQNGVNKAENAVKSLFKKKNKNAQSSAASGNSTDQKNDAVTNSTAPSLKAYANYDFIPGDKILFEDHFVDDQDGEFPSHWELEKGQGVVNKVNTMPAFFITEGNYAKVNPLIKNKSYLTDPFTIECDYMPNDGGYGINIFFESKSENGEERETFVNFNGSGAVSTGYFTHEFSNEYPDKNMADQDFRNKWHHVAIIYKNKQMKVYVDQYRVLVIPGLDFIPLTISVGGIASQEQPIVFKDFKIASGGNMNMQGKKFTDAKIITHGINFDVDKSIIKPESMGTINMIVQVMKDNPDLKFEIDGHTDNSGATAHNLLLSQQRADAVKAQLISMGIDASRLTSKGFGDTKPISDNTSSEGKANNRRVEFVKM